jgi:succinate dehydrogenase/fumarate reductase cytochrome b subunit
MPLRSLHRASALIVIAYAIFHIGNHLSALHGVTTHISIMSTLRVIYRQPVVEGLLLLCVLFQVASGLWMVVRGWAELPGFKRCRAHTWHSSSWSMSPLFSSGAQYSAWTRTFTLRPPVSMFRPMSGSLRPTTCSLSKRSLPTWAVPSIGSSRSSRLEGPRSAWPQHWSSARSCPLQSACHWQESFSR